MFLWSDSFWWASSTDSGTILVVGFCDDSEVSHGAALRLGVQHLVHCKEDTDLLWCDPFSASHRLHTVPYATANQLVGQRLFNSVAFKVSAPICSLTVAPSRLPSCTFWRPTTSKVATVLRFGNATSCKTDKKHLAALRSEELIFEPGKPKSNDGSTL